jgi:hypothetical protein
LSGVCARDLGELPLTAVQIVVRLASWVQQKQLVPAQALRRRP